MKKKLICCFLLVFLFGCGQMTAYHYKMTQQYTVAIENESLIAQEFFRDRWPVYSGALEFALEMYPNNIPTVVTTIKEKLDAIEPDKELTRKEIGYVLTARAFLLSEGFQALLNQFAPVLKYIF